jgi:hypothetical protein
LIVVLELVSDRVQQRAGWPHVSNGPPRPAPGIQHSITVMHNRVPKDWQFRYLSAGSRDHSHLQVVIHFSEYSVFIIFITEKSKQVVEAYKVVRC